MIDKVTDNLGTKEKALLMLLMKNPAYTFPQLAEKLNVSRKTVTVYINKLKEKMIITRIGSDRKGYWQINIEESLIQKADEK